MAASIAPRRFSPIVCGCTGGDDATQKLRGLHKLLSTRSMSSPVIGVSLMDPRPSWKRPHVDCEPLTTDQVHALLGAVPSETALGMGGDDDDLFRISLAGAQEKTALTKVGRRWCRPYGATPTTHIFKLPLGLVGGSRRVDLSDVVENEWLCAEILHAMRLPVAHTAMAEFAGLLYFGFRRVRSLLQLARCVELGFAYYRNIPQDKADNVALLESGFRLPMPVLALGGGRAEARGRGEEPLESLRFNDSDVRGSALPNCGHFIPEEQPALLAARMLEFFGQH